MPSLDPLGYLVINGIYFPLLPGSQGLFDPNLRDDPLASNLTEPINWSERFFQPVLVVITRLYGYANTPNPWSTAANIAAMFNRDRRTGQLLAGMGRCQWYYAGFPPQAWSNVKLAHMTISWDSLSGIAARLVLLPYSYSVPFRSQRHVSMTGIPFMGKAVSYGSTVDKIEAGSLQVSNNLVPLAVSPAFPSADGRLYPRDYAAGSLSLALQLAQRTDATRVVYPSTSSVGEVIVRFNQGAAGVQFAMRVRQPALTQTHRGGIAVNEWSYQGTRFSSTAGPLWIS